MKLLMTLAFLVNFGANILYAKEIHLVQGGTLIVNTEEAQNMNITLLRNYHHWSDGEITEGDEFKLMVENYTDSIQEIGVVDEDAMIEIRVKKKHQHLPITRFTVYDTPTGMEVPLAMITLPFDILLTSPVIGTMNFIHRRLDKDERCAVKSLEHLRNKDKQDEEMIISGRCYSFLIKNLEG